MKLAQYMHNLTSFSTVQIFGTLAEITAY